MMRVVWLCLAFILCLAVFYDVTLPLWQCALLLLCVLPSRRGT